MYLLYTMYTSVSMYMNVCVMHKHTYIYVSMYTSIVQVVFKTLRMKRSIHSAGIIECLSDPKLYLRGIVRVLRMTGSLRSNPGTLRH